MTTPGALGLREEVAEVLDGHDYFTPRGYAFVCCTCGEEFPESGEDGFRTHQADALLPLIERREAEAAKRALRDAASDVVADCSNQPGPCICTARHWLRDRADRIGGDSDA